MFGLLCWGYFDRAIFVCWCLACCVGDPLIGRSLFADVCGYFCLVVYMGWQWGVYLWQYSYSENGFKIIRCPPPSRHAAKSTVSVAIVAIKAMVACPDRVCFASYMHKYVRSHTHKSTCHIRGHSYTDYTYMCWTCRVHILYTYVYTHTHITHTHTYMQDLMDLFDDVSKLLGM